MHFEWSDVSEWEEGVAHGSQQVLWRRKYLYYTPRRGKFYI